MNIRLSPRGMECAERLAWNPKSKPWRELTGVLVGKVKNSMCWAVLWEGDTKADAIHEVYLEAFRGSASVPLEQLAYFESKAEAEETRT